MFSKGISIPHHAMEFIDTQELSFGASDIDHGLMVMVANGDEIAFRRLVERHQGAILGVVTKMLGNTCDSEDIAQQVFIRVWKHAKHYKPDNKFTTYLYTITRNLVYNESRRRSRKSTVSTNEREEQHLQHPDQSTASPDDALLDHELSAAIDEAIAKLPENQRLAVILRRYDMLCYEEIAKILNTSVPSVKSLLFRACTTLRDELSKYLEDN
jgi:RNA polymerase sigma-70 factor (ECF subfamily)